MSCLIVSTLRLVEKPRLLDNSKVPKPQKSCQWNFLGMHTPRESSLPGEDLHTWSPEMSSSTWKESCPGGYLGLEKLPLL